MVLLSLAMVDLYSRAHVVAWPPGSGYVHVYMPLFPAASTFFQMHLIFQIGAFIMGIIGIIYITAANKGWKVSTALEKNLFTYNPRLFNFNFKCVNLSFNKTKKQKSHF